MRRLRHRAIAFLLVTSVACATTGKFKQQMDTWLGGDINQAIMRLGPPSNTYTLPNGTSMFAWLWIGNTVVVSNYNQYLNMVTSRGGTQWCQISFTTAPSGQIQSWQANGNACRAR